MDGHHTPEQVKAAFARAHDILMDLHDHGVEAPRFELYADGSGRLVLGPRGEVTLVQYQRAVKQVFSERMDFDATEIAIRFCCGLVEHGEPEPPVYTEAELDAMAVGVCTCNDPDDVDGLPCLATYHDPAPFEEETHIARANREALLHRRPQLLPCASCRGKGFTCSCGDPDHVPCQSSHHVRPCPECRARQAMLAHYT